MNNRVEQMKKDWAENMRWVGVERPYSAEDVDRLKGSLQIEQTLAKRGSEKLWRLINEENYVNALGALTGNQAVQQVKAGLKAIYLSGWQVAADANMAGQMYPDQSLYPVNSVPNVVKRINQALQRADQIHYSEGDDSIDWFAPIVADAEAGFGGQLNVFELTKSSREKFSFCSFGSRRVGYANRHHCPNRCECGRLNYERCRSIRCSVLDG